MLKESVREMLKIIYRFKWYLVAIFVLIIAEPILNSRLNFWLQTLFNTAVPGAKKVDILRLLTLGFLMWILKRVISFLSGVLKARFICNTKQELKRKLFSNLMNLDTANILANISSGEYISAFTNDILILEQRFFNQVINLVSAFFSLIILGSSFMMLNEKLAGAIMVFGVFTIFVPAVFSKSLNDKNLRYSNEISKFTQALKEYLISYPAIKNYSIESVILQHFDAKNAITEEAKFEADYMITLANSVGSLLSWFMQFIAVGVGLVLVIKGEILIGTVISAQGFASDIALPMQEIIMNVNSIRSVKEIVKKMENFSSEGKCADLEKMNSSVVVNNGIDVVFEDVCLEISGKKMIQHFSFCFKAGKKYLILGINGSGKSSLFRVLKKWFSNFTGRILLEGQDIRTISNQQLSKMVSYLNENVSLFSWSIHDNISLFREYENKDFVKAIKQAQIELDLERKIIDEGRNVSSGEQRKIEIARSLLNAPSVLIFDEVVSTLDVETAYEIEKLALSFDKHTVIFVSHNFSGKLIREYDEILVMENGKLIDYGKYEDLMKSCPYFRKICEIKFGNFIK